MSWNQNGFGNDVNDECRSSDGLGNSVVTFANAVGVIRAREFADARRKRICGSPPFVLINHQGLITSGFSHHGFIFLSRIFLSDSR